MVGREVFTHWDVFHSCHQCGPQTSGLVMVTPFRPVVFKCTFMASCVRSIRAEMRAIVYLRRPIFLAVGSEALESVLNSKL